MWRALNDRCKEFEFLCGDAVWFLNYKNKEEEVRNGIVQRVSLTQKGSSWHYNIEIAYEEYDWFYDDGRMMTSGIWLVHTDKDKKVFKSKDELSSYCKV